jgi:hypothetical protein
MQAQVQGKRIRGTGSRCRASAAEAQAQQQMQAQVQCKRTEGTRISTSPITTASASPPSALALSTNTGMN